MIVAHVGGVPIEETLAAGGPALLAAVGAAMSQVHARLRRRRAELGVPSRKMDGLPHARLHDRAYGDSTVNSRSLEES
jgi:hypothetical protein